MDVPVFTAVTISEEKILGSRLLSYQELDILHALRGFCAFYVVVFHAKFVLWSGGREYLTLFPRALWTLWQYIAFLFDLLSSAGYEMVVVFFVLSGFFIRHTQLRKPRSAAQFYLNRSVRIYPPYLASIALAIGVLFVVIRNVPAVTTGTREYNIGLLNAWEATRHLDFLGALKSLLFMPASGRMYLGGNGVYWSLLPEVLFYLAVPFVFLRVRVYYMFSAVLFLASVWISNTRYNGSEIIGFLTTMSLYLGYFATGAALYDLIMYREWLGWFRRASGWFLTSTILGCFAGLIVLSLSHLPILSSVLAVILAVLVISVLLTGRISRHNLIVRVFHWIGLFSFTLYLCHGPLLLLCYGAWVEFTGELVFYTRFYWLAIPLVTFGCYGFYWITERVSVNYFRKV